MKIDLNSLVLFAKVVEAKSFAGAAKHLGMPLSTLSRRVAELEECLGVQLIERSTRTLRLTDVGAELLECARKNVEISEVAAAIIQKRTSGVAGTLRLSAPPSISDSLLAPLLNGFQTEHPDVRIQVLVTDRLVANIAEGVDLAFRVGPLEKRAADSTLVMTYRHQLLASPKYLEKHACPLEPSDLLQHRLLSFSFWKPSSDWIFVQTHGSGRQTITFEPVLSINEFGGLISLLLEGQGIGEVPPIVRPHLTRSGELVEVMPDWRFRTFALSLVHPESRHLTKTLTLFRDYVTGMAPKLLPDLPR
jgi:DNA-binding transcriptional LysR family regulator